MFDDGDLVLRPFAVRSDHQSLYGCQVEAHQLGRFDRLRRSRLARVVNQNRPYMVYCTSLTLSFAQHQFSGNKLKAYGRI